MAVDGVVAAAVVEVAVVEVVAAGAVLVVVGQGVADGSESPHAVAAIARAASPTPTRPVARTMVLTGRRSYRGASPCAGVRRRILDGVGLYREHGVVLRTIKLGEADRIVTLLTAGRGKVRAVAKGVRKTKSRFGSRLEPMVHVSLLLYEGRELDIVTQAETVEVFRAVREDLDRLSKAQSLLEACDQVAQEGHANLRLYQMLLGGLRALAAHDAPLLVPAFFLKLLAAEGFHPYLDECVVCGSVGDLCAFDQVQGGVLCGSCAQVSGGSPVTVDGLALVRLVLGGDLGAALNAPVGPATVEVTRLATRAFENHIERRLRSVGLIDRR